MLRETVGWALDHPFWSALILAVVMAAVVFALPASRPGR